jgi:hypothetical protein
MPTGEMDKKLTDTMNQPLEDVSGPNDSGEVDIPAPVVVAYAPASRSGASLLTVLTCWLRPATAAPSLTGIKLRRAWAIHILAAIVFFTGFLILADLDAWSRGGSYSAFGEIIHEFDRNAEEATLITVLTILGIEAGFAVLALIVLPWGAGDERLRSSWAHALRFTWLHTTHALPLLLVIGLVYLGIEGNRHSYYQTHSSPSFNFSPPASPTPPQNAAPNSQAWTDYQAAIVKHNEAVQEYWRNWRRDYQKWRRAQPFLVQHNEAMIGWLCIAGSAWILWALFRSVGVRRESTGSAGPPICEFCGYNLTGTAIEGRCPECGTPAIESLGPDVRPGPGWERGGGLRAGWRCAADAILRPTCFGHQIQLTTGPRRHRRLLWSLILPSVVIGAAATLICYVIVERHNPMEYEPEVVTIVAPMIGACSGAGMLMIAMLVAAVVGMLQTWLHKRNLLPAAAQMVSYLSPVFVAWGLFLAAWIALFCAAIRNDWFRDWLRAWGLGMDLSIFSILVLPQLVWLALCAVLTWKGTSAARYANR